MPTPTDLNRWLISDGRLLGDEIAIVRGYCQALVDMGVPLARVRVAQQYSNPILSAWGIIWTPQNTEKHVVPSTIQDTSAWKGSPFEHVITTRTSLRKRIMALDLSREHDAYAELAADGATDFFAMALEYGDGSVQGTSLTTHHPDGFSDADIQAFEVTRHALAAAMEPIAMRESQQRLLRTYLGDGPTVEIGDGHIESGENTSVSAAILSADFGPVTFGNIGSPDRLDYTVVGPPVNIASRVQAPSKGVNHPALFTSALAQNPQANTSSIGHHDIRGAAGPVELFRL
ncbi:hypothetical protein [Falsiruegeria mediterranea]